MQNTPHQQHNTNQATQQTKPHDTTSQPHRPSQPYTTNTNQATQQANHTPQTHHKPSHNK